MGEDAPDQATSPSKQQQPAVPVGKPLSLVPVLLKEAAKDTPSFRTSVQFLAEQIEGIEKWLENYMKAAIRLGVEVSSVESSLSFFLSQIVPPNTISEAIVDHDYSLLATKRFVEGSREFWNSTTRGLRKCETSAIEPIKKFLNNDLRPLKDARRNLEQTQKNFDSLLARFAAIKKTSEPSSIREDAFQLHEGRKAYLKASMDFCVIAPQVRSSLDKLLVKIFSDQWQHMKNSVDSMCRTFAPWGTEVDRVKGWSKEMEASEKAFIRSLHQARKQIEESAEAAARPPRELEYYSPSTVPQPGSALQKSNAANGEEEKAEKQGWLFLKTTGGKPTRTIWVRRWYFVKNGIFGWLQFGPRSGGVEESEKIGVLLCSVRPISQEERCFCFEVKTKDTSIQVQAESQAGLMEWISAFEVAKRKALDNPASTENQNFGPGVDAAFAISPPVAPEFAVKTGDSGGDESGRLERTTTLGVPDAGKLERSSVDFVGSRRPNLGDKDSEPSSGRDHAARIIQKLDLHRKATSGPSISSALLSSEIGSLITSSHNVAPAASGGSGEGKAAPSSLAPSTLSNPPVATNLSSLAVVISGERGVGLGRSDKHGGMPSGIMANIWGSTNWGYVNRLERGEVRASQELGSQLLHPPATLHGSLSVEGLGIRGDGDGTNETPNASHHSLSSATPSEGRTHRKTYSAGTENEAQRPDATMAVPLEYPKNYPLPLKAQDAQFRILFPNVPRSEKVVLVFKASWEPNDEQKFPGRVYVTTKEIYFYSHHLGFVLITGIGLTAIDEVTSSFGRDCDFLYLHLAENKQHNDFTRLTIKVFLEPVKLLERRLNFLVHNANSRSLAKPKTLEEVLTMLVDMEREPDISAAGHPSMLRGGGGINDPSATPGDWADLGPSQGYDPDDGLEPGLLDEAERHKDVRGTLHIDGSLQGAAAQQQQQSRGTKLQARDKFRLPAHPVLFTPRGMGPPALAREFDLPAKPLFHAMFGDRSPVFVLHHQHQAPGPLAQGPWTVAASANAHGHRVAKRALVCDAPSNTSTSNGTSISPSSSKDPAPPATSSSPTTTAAAATVTSANAPSGLLQIDHQQLDIAHEHLCYVVTSRKTLYHLPRHTRFLAVTKYVITHRARARAQLAIYHRIEWTRRGAGLLGPLIEAHALAALALDAADLVELVDAAAARLGPGHGHGQGQGQGHRGSAAARALALFGPVATTAGSDMASTANNNNNTTTTTTTTTIGPASTSASASAAQMPALDVAGVRARARSSTGPQTTLTSLVARVAVARTVAVARSALSLIASSALSVAGGAASALRRLVSAHAVLLLALLLSVALHVVAGSRAVSDWRRQRAAERFVNAMGLGPVGPPVRVVGLGEIDRLLSPRDGAGDALVDEVLGHGVGYGMGMGMGKGAGAGTGTGTAGNASVRADAKGGSSSSSGSSGGGGAMVHGLCGEGFAALVAAPAREGIVFAADERGRAADGTHTHKSKDDRDRLDGGLGGGGLGGGGGSVTRTTRAATARLRRARRRLGALRHELLVAMRVVNSVEAEAVRAEWEAWVWEESARCGEARGRGWLGDGDDGDEGVGGEGGGYEGGGGDGGDGGDEGGGGGGGGGGNVKGGVEEGVDGDGEARLVQSMRDYCRSCASERRELERGGAFALV